tara:strand:- start:26080 stop:26973 length:894 start_codon:yes stop_codon:yes gene_type:complete
MSWLNYHHLLYFKTIATEGSISKASEKLNVGQPALSAQLKQLEESFDQKLFERKNRQLILTDAGKATLKYANQIYSLGTELQEMLRDKTFSVRPHLNIGSLDSVPKHLSVRLIQAAQKIQDCNITLLDGTGDELYRQLINHSIDLVLANHHIMADSEEKSVYSRCIGKLPVHVYGAKEFAPLQDNFPQSLEGQSFILPTNHSKLRHDIEHFFEAANINYKVSVNVQDTAIQKFLAMEGVGLIAEPEFAVKRYLDEGKIVKLGSLKGVFEEFFLISTKRIVDNPIATQLMRDFSFADY